MKMVGFKKLQSVLFLGFCLFMAIVLAGCSDSKTSTGDPVNPMAAYTSPSGSGGLPTNGQTQDVGKIDTPIVNVPYPTDGRNDHTNAPLLDNWHPGWQQTSCFSCHTDQSRIPDHSYTSTDLCYLCHGTNGVPGFGDATPPMVKGVIANAYAGGVSIVWTTDEPCISRLILRTKEGDRLEFPVSIEYVTSHKYSVSGLLSDTSYTYEIIAIDKNNNTTTTATFGTLTFTTPSSVSTSTPGGTSGTQPTSFHINLTVTAEDAFSIRVKFQTVKECTSAIHYLRKSDSYHLEQQVEGSASNYNVYVPNMKPDTDYEVWVVSTTSDGSKYTSSKRKVKTPAE